jgi:hypothetical protein
MDLSQRQDRITALFCVPAVIVLLLALTTAIFGLGPFEPGTWIICLLSPFFLFAHGIALYRLHHSPLPKRIHEIGIALNVLAIIPSVLVSLALFYFIFLFVFVGLNLPYA